MMIDIVEQANYLREKTKAGFLLCIRENPKYASIIDNPEEFFDGMWDAVVFTEGYTYDPSETINYCKENKRHNLFLSFFMAGALAKQAVIWDKEGLKELAIMSLFLANFTGGMASMMFSHETNPASILAKKRHEENYALHDEAVKFWRENIPENISASKAANKLITVVPLSHKKLAEIISKEKKKSRQ
jgi:hypothetical protein